MPEHEEPQGGFQHVGYYVRSQLLRLLVTELSEQEFEGGWKALHNIEDSVVTVLHGPTGTQSSVYVDLEKGINLASFNFVPDARLQGAGNAEMEAVHRFFYFQWNGQGDPLREYQKTKG